MANGDLSDNQIRKLTKTHVILPQNPEDLIEKYRAQEAITSCLFRPDSPIPQSLTYLIHWCLSHRGEIKARILARVQHISSRN